MARIQILELPDVEKPDGTFETPFVLVIDQVATTFDTLAARTEVLDEYQRMAENTGARAALVFAETMEIPANEFGLDPDGKPVRLRAADEAVDG